MAVEGDGGLEGAGALVEEEDGEEEQGEEGGDDPRVMLLPLLPRRRRCCHLVKNTPPPLPSGNGFTRTKSASGSDPTSSEDHIYIRTQKPSVRKGGRMGRGDEREILLGGDFDGGDEQDAGGPIRVSR